MPRPVEICFGSFGERLGTAVFANDWWLFAASTVQVDHPHAYFDLSERLEAGVGMEAKPTLESHPRAWVEGRLPIALQVDTTTASNWPVGLVAVRVEEVAEMGRRDVAYPFLLTARDARVVLAFSRRGPASAVRESIIAAFLARLGWGAG